MARQTFQFRNQLVWMASLCVLAGATMAPAQQTAIVRSGPAQTDSELPAGTPLAWAEDAVRNELKVIEAADTVPLRYRQRKVNAKGDTTREIIESKDGNVARLVERNGQPISAKEDAAERARLMEDINSPDDFLKHHRKDTEIRDSVIKLVKMMPQAMTYTYTPGQPQSKDSAGLQVVLDFHPNPSFHPPTMFSEALTGLEGRVWIDAQSHYLTRIEGRVLHPVDMGFGLVAKIYPGGTLELEQTRTPDGQWVYSHLDEHLTARVLVVKTLPEDTVVTSWDFRSMSSLLSFQDGARMLLAMPVAVQ
jgi:hypothetical protein